MRTFLAFDIDNESILKIKEIQNKIKENFDLNLRYTKENQLHLTTFFLGDISNEDKVKNILLNLNYPSKFSLCVDSLKFLPKNNSANVISLSFEAFSFLDSFINEQDTNLKLLNFVRDKTFLPHITIARSREKIKFFEFDFKPFNINIDSFSFYESILSPKGSIYNKLFDKML